MSPAPSGTSSLPTRLSSSASRVHSSVVFSLPSPLVFRLRPAGSTRLSSSACRLHSSVVFSLPSPLVCRLQPSIVSIDVLFVLPPPLAEILHLLALTPGTVRFPSPYPVYTRPRPFGVAEASAGSGPLPAEARLNEPARLSIESSCQLIQPRAAPGQPTKSQACSPQTYQR